LGYYWMYYALSFFVAYAVRNPWACGVALAFLAVRRWLPDPVVLFKNLARVGALRRRAELNPADAVARKQLGLAYLALLRPRAALRVLDEARSRTPREPEVAYLRGIAMLRLHDDEGALRAFAESLGIDPDKGEPFSAESMRAGEASHSRYGDAYLSVATALERLGRLEQAEEALVMSASCNSSALEPRLRLASVRRARGDAKGAREAIEDAKKTWGQLPPFMRRTQLGWGIRAWGAWLFAR
jgi:tetratricopeptide (TPR) repeat protein